MTLKILAENIFVPRIFRRTGFSPKGNLAEWDIHWKEFVPDGFLLLDFLLEEISAKKFPQV